MTWYNDVSQCNCMTSCGKKKNPLLWLLWYYKKNFKNPFSQNLRLIIKKNISMGKSKFDLNKQMFDRLHRVIELVHQKTVRFVFVLASCHVSFNLRLSRDRSVPSGQLIKYVFFIAIFPSRLSMRRLSKYISASSDKPSGCRLHLPLFE